jgi:hypothetical protein
MAPTHQEETNQKLSIGLTTLQAQVNKDIPTIHAKIDLIQEHLSSQIVEFHSTLHQFMNKLEGSSSYDPPLYIEGVDSNQPLHSHSNSLHCDPRLSRVEENKFDGSDPQAWVTQMKHYFSMYGITYELTKLRYGFLYLDLEQWK